MEFFKFQIKNISSPTQLFKFICLITSREYQESFILQRQSKDEVDFSILTSIFLELSVIIISIQNPQNSNMNSFQNSPRISQSQIRQQTIQRQGDWICYQCNNLNFSFRKRCNRCKSQTREQNQQYFSYFMDSTHQWAYATDLYHELTNSPQNFSLEANNTQAEHIYFQTQCQPSQFLLNPESPSSSLQISNGIYSSDEMNWNIFLNKEQEYNSQDYTQSDESGQNSQENLQLDYDIYQMVSKIII